MKDFFQQDRIVTGLVAGLGSEIVSAVLIWLVLTLLSEPVEAKLRIFAAVFIVPVLVLRYYAKGHQHPVVTKTLIVVLFLTFISFMMLLFKTNALSS